MVLGCRLAAIQSFLESSSSPHVFVKDMAYMVEKSDYDFIPKGYTHTFLIRHPFRVFSSFRKATFKQFSTLGLFPDEVAADEEKYDFERDLPYINLSGLLFKDLYDIWKFAKEDADFNLTVVDGDDLMSNPAEILPKYCRAVGLPYRDALLKWDASAKGVNEWKVPANLLHNQFHFHERSVTSSEFYPPSPMPERDQLTSDVIRCADQMMPYYNEMYAARI